MRSSVFGVCAIVGLAGCASGDAPPPGSDQARPANPAPTTAQASSTPADPQAAGVAEPAEGQAIRVGGEMDAKAEFRDGNFYAGPCSITTPLPEGYPAPTPPGAIELKRYPSVRRAEVSGSMTPDLGMNMAFFPLFNHIKDRKIAMTSPVEMNYSGVDRPKTDTDPPARPEGWTMSFLYRTADLGPTGADDKRKQVKVVDAPAVTVVSLGLRGSYSWARIRRESRNLERWLEEQQDWEAAGEMRALYYNGPEKREADKWAEVQVPVRRRSTDSGTPRTE